MASNLTQDVLDALTDVAMPKLAEEPVAGEIVEIRGVLMPVFRPRTLVLGSGAAGLRAAVELKRRGIDVLVATQSAWGGTSACSGSDKQTLHTANGAGRGDDFVAMAAALGAGGAMDEDTAYVEAVGSSRMLASLQYLGLPLPQDRFGGALRYQTDHDVTGRATSCGPRTSRLMVQVLAREAIALGVPILNQAIGVKLLVDETGSHRCVGALLMQPNRQTTDNPLGLAAVLCDSIVIATGGPGELYRDSVYPRHCFGSLGMALEAGIGAVNLTESQFGIGTPRDSFPWNLSGTYAQAMPHVVSRDAAGTERNVLAGYYRSTRELASNLFRKGYQWPFHATRMLDFGSSLFDLAVLRETALGRKVYLDFNRNPMGAAGDKPFGLDDLDSDVRSYLQSAGALLATPIERLRKMNPLSIELYKRYKYDIAAEPLEFAVNNQHMNGGLAVDVWGRTDLAGCYAVGEAAGTHGVTRPGGAALNAGQVMGTRIAEHIASRRPGPVPDVADCLGHALAAVAAAIRPEGAITIAEIRSSVQARMSDCAGVLCRADRVRGALEEARSLNRQIRHGGIACPRPGDAARVLQWAQTALASEAVLAALDFYIAGGGGSRGARAILDPKGDAVPLARDGAMEDYRFKSERAEQRAEQIVVRRAGDGFLCQTRPIRRRDRNHLPVFERDWPAFLSGAIYDDVN